MSDVWSPSDKIETIVISERAANNIAAGNLWVFSNEIRSKPPQVKKGTWCHFQSDGRTVGFGYFNDHSLIAGRVVSAQAPLNISTLVRQKIEASFQRCLSSSGLDSARLIFSEADFLPGLVLDCFSGVLVLQSNTAGIDAILSLLEEIVPTAYEKVFGKKSPTLFANKFILIATP
jgi:23S rRNA (cytosine1962-C5)-methyltransferase